MSSTILYCVDDEQAAAAAAEGSVLEVLTVATKVDGALARVGRSSRGKAALSRAGGKTGLAGHVLLTRPSGGMLLTASTQAIRRCM